jgi:hypothetical protein
MTKQTIYVCQLQTIYTCQLYKEISDGTLLLHVRHVILSVLKIPSILLPIPTTEYVINLQLVRKVP